MHVSETAVLCSVYVLLAVSLAVLSCDGPRAHWAGLPFGLATGLMLAGGRSPWPLTALVAAALLGRVVLGPPRRAIPCRAAAVFWGGFGLGASVFFLLLDDAYRTMTESYAHFTGRSIPVALRSSGEWLLGRPAAVAGLAALGLALEIAAMPAARPVAARIEQSSRKLVRWTALGLAALVLISFATSLLIRSPSSPSRQSHR